MINEPFFVFMKAVRCFSEALGRRKHVEVFLALSQLHIENDEKEKAMEVLKQGL